MNIVFFLIARNAEHIIWINWVGLSFYYPAGLRTIELNFFIIPVFIG